MKKRWIALGVVALMGAAGYWGWEANKYRVPGLMQDWNDPVQPNRPVAWQAGPAAAPAGNRPPNIILIVADDLGWNDISLNGGGVADGTVKTPNIDALAREGMNFTTAYAANATCSPSRAAMMTGRYATRFGFEYTAVPVQFSENLAHGDGVGPLKAVFHKELITPDIPDYPDMGVPASEVTIAEAVKTAGYHTLHIGKWHLGEAPKLQPHAQGFDESLAVLGGAAMFLPEDDPDTVNAKLPWDPIDRFLWANLRHAVTFNGSKRFHPKGHMTDYFADQAIAAIEANKNRPFFMYLAFNAPHTPLQATKEDYARYPQIKDHKTRVYGAMIAQL
ncbi:MAG TPA: sulfatase-like hydrolase/transferase, partial [Sphingopyxis sp.]|nr:sulfatase-like hydrolase/transferase [Sphingopyxis sp.]